MMKLYKLIIYSGIIAFAFLCMAATAGLTHISYNLHIVFGIAALIFSCIHVGLIIFRKHKL